MTKQRSRSLGRPRIYEEGSRKDYLLRLPADLHEELRQFAHDEKRSLNDVLVEAISTWWERKRPTKRR